MFELRNNKYHDEREIDKIATAVEAYCKRSPMNNVEGDDDSNNNPGIML